MSAKKALLDLVKAELECPVCLETILDPPVHLCKNGHMFCATCYHVLMADSKACPVCRGTLSGGRCLFAEQILAKLPKKKCKNKVKGCEFETAGKVQDHEAACKFRNVACFYCDELVTVAGLGDHLAAESPDGKDGKTPYQLTLGESLKYWIMGAFERRFFPLELRRGSKTQYFFLVLEEHQNRILLWVYHDESRNATKKYEYTISIISGSQWVEKKEVLRLVKYTGCCLPLDVKIGAMKKSQFCLTIPTDIAYDHSDSEDKIWFELSICKATYKDNMLN